MMKLNNLIVQKIKDQLNSKKLIFMMFRLKMIYMKILIIIYARIHNLNTNVYHNHQYLQDYNYLKQFIIFIYNHYQHY